MEKLVQKDWVINVNVKLNQMKDSSVAQMEQYWKKRSIYSLPASVRELNKHAYKPQVVSFGPFHHGQPHLKPMEVHKERAFLLFLKRSNKPLQCYIDSLVPVVQDLMESYDSLDTIWQKDTEAFLHFMILDGCFMLEILRMSASINGYNRYTWKGSSSSGYLDKDDGNVADYAPNDPIFSNHGNLYIMPYIKRDMLMLENQLPMLLLQNLLAVQNDRTMHKEFLNYHILKFYAPNVFVRDIGDCLHVLDVYKQKLILGDGDGIVEDSVPCKFDFKDENEIMWSATELHNAGIQFKKSKSSSLKDIAAFTSGGVLKIPRIIIDDTTESMFLNLIAFERLHVGAGNEVTSYIFLMGNIIDNTKDVSLLTLKGIIQNAIGGDKAVAKLFNSLCKDITLDPNSNLDAVQRCVHHYCMKPWNKWRATLVHTYFSNPWAILSVFAAFFLFVLTIVQTIYTVLQLYQPKDSPPSS